MFRKNRKLKTGYKKKPKQKTKPFALISSLLIDEKRKTPISEKIVKFMIYIALRLVIKPSKWKDPQKNFEIINRTYTRVMSSDFIFIPSSIAFYLIMSFMPIVTAVFFIYTIPGFSNFIEIDGRDSISAILGKFIPGIEVIIKSLRDALPDLNISKDAIPVLFFLIITIWIAAGGFAKIIYTQSYIYGHRFLGGYWMNKFRGMWLVIQLTIALALGLLLNVVIDGAIGRLPINDLAKDAIRYIVLIILLFILIFSMFIVFYKFSPRFKIKFRHILPGAMVSALPITLFLTFFGLITSLWSYDQYGVIGTVMYIGMTSLIITHCIFMGITTNAAYYKTFVGVKVPTKWTISKK